MEFNLQMLRNQLSAMWRWRWLGLAICWAVILAGTAYVLLMPDRYRSEAQVYVDTDTILTDLMEDLTVGTDVDQQVRVMERTLLSRPNIQRVIRTVDLDLELESEAEWERAINEMTENVRISTGRDKVFVVAYSDSDPKVARDVVQALLSIFVESNLGENRADIQQSRKFLDDEIALNERRLREAEQRLAAFKSKHLTLLSTAGSYPEKISESQGAVNDALSKYEEAKIARDSIARQLGRTRPFLDLDQAPQIIVGDAKATTTLGQIRQLQGELNEMKLKYTDQHPDIIVARQRLQELLARRDREQRGIERDNFAGRTQVPNPLYEQLSLKLVDAEAEMGRMDRRLAQAKKSLVSLQELAADAPAIEAEAADLNRDYEIIQSQYNKLLQRRESASLSQSMEANTQAISYEVLQEPFLPVKPFGPPRPLYLAALLVIGMGGGVASSYLRGQLDDNFPNTRKLQDTFGLPVLGAVSYVGEATKAVDRRKQYLGFGALAGTPVMFIAAVIVLLPFLSQLRV